VSISSSLLYSIIYYERNCLNRNRTFVNKLVSLLCSLCIEYGFTATATDILRCFLGPFPIIFCRLEELTKISYLQQKLLILDAVLISRYIFIFLLKNPLAFKDDFWSKFISLLTRTSSFIILIVLVQLSPNEAWNVYICAGSERVRVKTSARAQMANWHIWQNDCGKSAYGKTTSYHKYIHKSTNNLTDEIFIWGKGAFKYIQTQIKFRRLELEGKLVSIFTIHGNGMWLTSDENRRSF